ncbi:MAG: D-arabinono-1,4-lactone oxidase [Endozoicomonas sp.]|uniref:D-arabinono-1,4-lactone oxidase n=1 Tax=Endozoicomonas sp. TaxID=1892382 RepID=UPI003D9AC78C
MKINRRQFFKMASIGSAGIAATTLTGCNSHTTPPVEPEVTGSGEGIPWRNWSGSQIAYPGQKLAPANTQEVQEIVAQSEGVIRAVGSGHSFPPLVPTEGTIMSLSRLSGVVSHDEKLETAQILSGTRLGDMGQLLEDRGQALINMPDIDKQSLAGAISTSTHGTGMNFGSLSSYVTALKIVNADGELIECSADNNPELFSAARVSLGSLGIITEIEMQNQQPFRLQNESWAEPIEDLLAKADQLKDEYRNFEFYYIPHTDYGIGYGNRETSDTSVVRQPDTSNEDLGTLQMVNQYLGWSRGLQKTAISTFMPGSEPQISRDVSWKIYSAQRNVRFNEMEFHVPMEHGIDCLKEIIQLVDSDEQNIWFPIEFRYVKQDDIWLSPFYKRDTCSIAVHQYYKDDYHRLHKAAQKIFARYHGRPHWGKNHYLQATDFKKLYPMWDQFQEIRHSMDPKGKFLNHHLKQVMEG